MYIYCVQLYIMGPWEGGGVEHPRLRLITPRQPLLLLHDAGVRQAPRRVRRVRMGVGGQQGASVGAATAPKKGAARAQKRTQRQGQKQ